ncbi:mucoidy inhibitor MuiA family protein [Anderseniella sp. Alg231-50]|uniref:mucoidy inhibitor MuiA family protein n=1 Tax=Anderseniella sp. Alg231-50 TaxID=1922226 RepID=UPI000D55A78F
MMKLHCVLLSGVFLSLSLVPALADEIRTELDLVEVTVNPRGAQLTRTGLVELPAGAHELVLDTLPQGIMAASVQVEAVSVSDAEIGTVDVSRIALDPEQEATGKRKSLQDELEALARDRARHERVRVDAQFRRATLERLTGGFAAIPFASGDKPVLSPEQIGNLLLLTSRELSEISSVVLEADQAIVQIGKREQVLRRQLQLLATTPKARTRVAIQVSASAPAKMTLSVKYSVSDAGWRPVYDARLKLPAGGKPAELKLVQRALVYQRSGEAWDGVALKLSTATVTGRTASPILQPVAIGPQPDKVRPAQPALESFSDTTGTQEMRSKTAAGLAASAPAPVRQRQAEVSNAGFHAVYSIAGQTSVPNSGALKSVRIGARTVEPAIRVDTAPHVDPVGYLTGVFTIAGETPLLAGEVSLFRDGVFAGKARMRQIAPGEETELGFGRDDLVRVIRREVENTAGSSGIITEQSTLRRLYVTSIENLHTFAVQVHVTDRMPYSTHEEVVVDMLRETTEPSVTEPDNKKGIVVWDVPLEPQAKSEIRFGYTVVHPSQMKLAIPR